MSSPDNGVAGLEDDTHEHRAPRPTVAVAIPDLLVAQALGHLLRAAEMHVVGCYTTFDALLDKLQRCRPQIAVVDADLREDPKAADLFLARQRAASPETRIVVVTSDVDTALARAVVAHDVRAVILRSAPVDDALAVLGQVVQGRTSFPAAVLARLDARRDEDDTISSRQLEVLEQLALGCSNQEIARTLFISVNTVKFHLQAIYARLGVRNRVEAAAVLATRRSQVSGPVSQLG